MRHLALLLAALIAMIQPAKAQTGQPYSYKGFVLGVTTYQEWAAMLSAKQLKQTSKQYQCSKGQQAIRECNPPAGVGGIFGTFTFLDDHLASLETVILGSELRGYVDALTEKFGTPTITTETFQNGFGATRTGRVWTWQNGISQIALEEFAPGSFGSSIGPYSVLKLEDLKLATNLLKRTEKKPVI
jgi:hypothetical protein